MEMKDFLLSTRYCDCDSNLIKSKTKELINGICDDDEKAVKLFNFVRDNFLYTFGPWNIKASETLQMRKGMCTNKSNLLIALLRAVGIPAGYGILRVNAKEYFGFITLPLFKKFISSNSVHIYCYVYLKNKWIKCDPSTDKQFANNIGYFNPPSKLVEWNGNNDAIANIDTRHIIGNEGPIANIDSQLEKKTRNLNERRFKLANYYMKYLRENKINFVDSIKLEKDFGSWLKKESSIHFFFFKVLKLIAFFKNNQ